jgi:hypothetical protein
MRRSSTTSLMRRCMRRCIFKRSYRVVTVAPYAQEPGPEGRDAARAVEVR